MQGKKKLTFEERNKLRQKIDKAQRRKLKLIKGKSVGPGPPKEVKFIAVHAYETSGGDPLRALTAAVDAIRVAELIK